MGVVGEVHGLLLQHPLARDKYTLISVDQNVFYFGVGHQVIQRPQPRQLLVKRLCNPLHFLVIDGKALLAHKLLQLLLHKLAHTPCRPLGKDGAQLFHACEQMLVRYVFDEQQLLGIRKIVALLGKNNIHAHSPLLRRLAH